MKIKKGDIVKIITGDNKGSTGKVLKVLQNGKRVVVDGVNKITSNSKKVKNKFASIDRSNVIVCNEFNNDNNENKKTVKNKKVEHGKNN